MKIGEFLSVYRKERNMSMEELANKCGLSKAYISKLEADTTDSNKKHIQPSIQTFNKIANGLNMQLTDLLSTLDGEQEIILNTENELKNTINKSYINQFINILDFLNDTGKKEAIKRIKELTYIPCYMNDEYITEVAARGNSRKKVKLNKAAIKEDLENYIPPTEL